MTTFPRTVDEHRRIALLAEWIGVWAVTEHALELLRASQFDDALAALGEGRTLVRRAKKGDAMLLGVNRASALARPPVQSPV